MVDPATLRSRPLRFPDVTGLAAVALVLVSIFALPHMSFIHRGPVVLPLARAPDRWGDRPDDVVVVLIAKRGPDGTFTTSQYWVDKQKYGRLEDALREVPRARSVLVQADARLPVGPVLRVIEGLGARGHTRVFLCTEVAGSGGLWTRIGRYWIGWGAAASP